MSDRLNPGMGQCFYQYFGGENCLSGQIQVYVDCDGLNYPNDYPANVNTLALTYKDHSIAACVTYVAARERVLNFPDGTAFSCVVVNTM